MSSVPAEFKRFVQSVEEHQQHNTVNFTTLKELTSSVGYFYERAILLAVQRPGMATKFAEMAAKIYYLKPVNCESELSFRKALLQENQKHSEALRIYLSKYNGEQVSEVSEDRAIGIYTFFGELFNHKFLIVDIVKRHFDVLKSRKETNAIAKKCLHVLAATVKNKVIQLSSEDQFSYELKVMLETCEAAEQEKLQDQTTRPKNLNSNSFATNFPVLNGFGNPNHQPSSSNDKAAPTTAHNKLTSFKLILQLLTASNSAEIIKKIEANDEKLRFEDETWQLYYTLLIEKALAKPELAEAVVDICRKLARPSTDAWHGPKIDEYKKFINNFINQKLEKLLVGSKTKAGIYEAATKDQLQAILNFIEKLLQQSLYSVGHLKTTVQALINCADNDKALAPSTLRSLMKLIKTNMKASQIKKLPEEIRKKIIEIINEKDQAKLVGEIADYMKIEYEKEEDEEEENEDEAPTANGTSSSSSDDEPSQAKVMTNGNGTNAVNSDCQPPPSVKANSLNQSRNLNESMLEEYHDASDESPHKCLLPELPVGAHVPSGTFDYPIFIKSLMTCSEGRKANGIRVAMRMPGWNLVNFTSNFFNLSIQYGPSVKDYIKAAVIFQFEINSPVFKSLLWRMALDAFSKELTKEPAFEGIRPDQIEAHESTAMFIGGLFNIGWVTRDTLFHCIDQITSNHFNTIRRMKIFLALLKSTNVCAIKGPDYDGFISHLQSARARVNEVMDEDHRSVYIELIKTLENITGTNAMFSDSPIKTYKLDLFSKALSAMDFNDLDDCLKKIAALNIETLDDLKCFVVVFRLQGSGGAVPASNCTRLASKIDLEVEAGDVHKLTFKSMLADACRDKFLEVFKDAIMTSRAGEEANFLIFILQLIKVDIIPWHFTTIMMDVLLKHDTAPITISCIEIAFREIGRLYEVHDIERLRRYFAFFQSIVEKNEPTIRSICYRNLIKIRQNGWYVPRFPRLSLEPLKALVEQPKLIEPNKAPNEEVKLKTIPELTKNTIEESKTITETASTLTNELPTNTTEPNEMKRELKSVVIDFDVLDDRDEMETIAAALKECLTSRRLVKNFIAAILGLNNTNHNYVLSINKLFKVLADVVVSTKIGGDVTFKECLVEALNVQFVKYNSKQTLAAEDELAVSSLLLMVCEMYRQDMFSDNDLATWLISKHMNQVPLHHVTHLSAIVQPKVQVHGGQQIKLLLGMIDSSIHSRTMATCAGMKDDLNELADIIKDSNSK